MGSDVNPRPASFVVEFPPCDLAVEDIWPDGNAPENPNAADVAAQMASYGGALSIIRDWNLLTELEVHGYHDGSREVVR